MSLLMLSGHRDRAQQRSRSEEADID